MNDDTSPTATIEPRAQRVPEHAGSPKILIADDDRNIRLALRACLECEGYEIEEARDGREVISSVIHGSVDLVLLDLAMPHMGGLAALRELATTYREIKPRIIVLTAWGSVTAAQQADQFGANAFVEKPLDTDSLRSIVARVLHEKRDFTAPSDDEERYPERFLG